MFKGSFSTARTSRVFPMRAGSARQILAAIVKIERGFGAQIVRKHAEVNIVDRLLEL